VICEFGDVVVVPFPFVDQPIVKRRPAVVLSSRPFNADNDHSVLCMITTGARSAWPSDIQIGDLAEAGISHRSVIRWKLFTLSNLLILRLLGKLGSADRHALKAAAGAVLAG
jgi:mRNA interferase MazF